LARSIVGGLEIGHAGRIVCVQRFCKHLGSRREEALVNKVEKVVVHQESNQEKLFVASREILQLYVSVDVRS